MKERLRKITIISCVIFFAFFSILIQPQQKAHAIAIPAVLTGSVALYTLGALGTAAVVGIACEECADRIAENGKQMWDSNMEFNKTMWDGTVLAAQGTGLAVSRLGIDALDWLKDKQQGFAIDLANTAVNASMEITPGNVFTNSGTGSVTLTMSEGFRMGLQSNFASKHLHGGGLWTIKPSYLSSGGKFLLLVNISSGGTSWSTVNWGRPVDTIQQAQGFIGGFNHIDSVGQLVAYINSSMIGNSMMYYNTGASSYGEMWNQTHGQVFRQMQETWETMRDAGLVIPVDEFVPMSVDGQKLDYDVATGALTDAAGKAYSGDWTMRTPQLKYREKSDTISIPGVYVNTPTYVPELDKADNPAKDVPQTTTHITTGTTTANPDFATDIPTTPPIPGTPPPPIYIPPFEDDGSSALDFTPLMQSGEVMSQKFPFSIPFDLFRQISVFDVAPESPVFDINVPSFLKIEGTSIPMKFSMKFDLFDPIANIIRWGNIILFDIGLILMIRRLMPE